MAHECEDCGETFGTLSALRLHHCPADEDADGDDWEQEVEEHMAEIRRRKREGDRMAERAASSEFTEALDAAGADDTGALHRALAQYERHLATEWAKSDDSDDRRYWGFQRVFEEPAVAALDEAVVAEGWPFLLDVLEAYWPTVSQDVESYPDAPDDQRWDRDDYDDFAHVSHVLTLVTGKQLVRTRQQEGVDAIPARALEFQRYFHRHPSDNGPWHRSMSYGWGIGHPDHPVRDTLRLIVAGGYEAWASTAVQHALYADQAAATALLEDWFDADLVSDPALFLSSVGRIDDGNYPDSTGQWDWETIYPELGEGLAWEPGIEERLRSLAEGSGIVEDLPADWQLADIVL